MARSTFGGLLFYNSDAKGSLGVVFPSHHPRHSFLRLDELIPVEPLVQFSERFAAVTLDAVLGHTFLKYRPDLHRQNSHYFEKQSFSLFLSSPADICRRRGSFLHLQCYGRKTRQVGGKFFHILSWSHGVSQQYYVAVYATSRRHGKHDFRRIHLQLFQNRPYRQYPCITQRSKRILAAATDDGLLSVRACMGI